MYVLIISTIDKKVLFDSMSEMKKFKAHLNLSGISYVFSKNRRVMK